MGGPPYTDETERKMLEQSLSNSIIKMRPYCEAFHKDYVIPSLNWLINFAGLILFGFGWLCEIIGAYALILWIKMMDLLGRRRIIMDRVNDEPYLERYYIFLKDRSESFPFNVFIHKFLKSDPDDLHDHPWGYFTLILSGGYWEYMYEDGPPPKEGESDSSERKIIKKWRGPGFFQSVSAEHTHRIEIDHKKATCWTLFIPRRRMQEWGFYKKISEGLTWVESEKYLSDRKKSN